MRSSVSIAAFLSWCGVVVVVAGALGALPACSRTNDKGAPAGSAAVPLAATGMGGAAGSTAAAAAGAKEPPVVLDFLADRSGTCTLGHRGVLLDLGEPAMRARMSAAEKITAPDLEVREHEGATWVALHDRTLALSFVSPDEIRPEQGVVIEARVRGAAAKSAVVYLDGKPLGGVSLPKGETKLVSVRAPYASIARGSNEVMFRFIGGTRAAHDELAEIDWVRVGPYDGDEPYAAPTRRDAIATVTLGGVARRGVALRAPGFARCSGFIPNGAVLEGFVGASGGEADAEVRLLVDRAEPRVVGSFHLGGEGSPPWRPVSLPLGEAGTIGAVELVAKSSTKGARVVFAEPKVTLPAAAPPVVPQPRSKGVIVVVLGSTPPKMLSPWGGSIATNELAQLASGGVVFEANRATTSHADGAVASMLTGLAPREHGVTDSEAALRPEPVTIAEAARQAGVVTAMFTANPTTTAAFGFARGWETFVARSPADEAPATAVFDDAAKWLDAHKTDRFLLFIHARGGHPPWDVGAAELKDMPPAGYAGSLDPKHAGESLGKAQRSGVAHALSDADRERAFALHARAIAAHDAALGKLVAAVRAIGREPDTTWIVTGDVGVDAGAHVPFIEQDALDEAALAVPLVVKAPKPPPHARSSNPTSDVDVARTALEALGLAAPAEMRGESLWRAAQRTSDAPSRATVATVGTRFSARWGGFVLVGAREREAKLCNLSLEPECVSDVRTTHPLAAEVMHALAFDELVAKKPAGPPTHPTAIDAPLAAALRAWGR